MGSFWIVVLVASLLQAKLSDGNTEPSPETDCTFYQDEIATLETKVGELTHKISLLNADAQTSIVDCPRSQYVVKRSNNIQDYIKYRRYFPRLKAATMCMWVNFDELAFLAPLLSYESLDHPNHILIELRPEDSLIRLIIFESQNDFNFVANISETHHICAWFDSSASTMGFFIDGKSIGSKAYSGATVEGGGSLVLGQDEDRNVNGGFHGGRAVRGSMKNTVIFPRVLTGDEIIRMGVDCKCPIDYQVALTLDKVEMWGETTYGTDTQCPILSQ